MKKFPWQGKAFEGCAASGMIDFTMISHLRGEILHKDLSYLILEVSGVGYRIFATRETIEGLPLANAALWTHLAIRENSHDLYGFLTRDELFFFELLISISGIGPKTALGILNVASIETLHQAVRQGNTAHLIKVGGIGKKNAEKIVLELQDKLGGFTAVGSAVLRDEEDVVEALGALGYSQKESRDALRTLSSEITGTGERVKQVLKILSKKE